VTHWSLADLRDQSGRTVVVTGVSVGGLGHYTAHELAARGAVAVLAGRTETKLKQTESAIRALLPDAQTRRLVVDLADLTSVRRAAGLAEPLGPIDVLVNNAGVMATPYQRTVDGFELQMATNHFGPFLLTGLLLDQLVASGRGRVVTVASLMHRLARSAPLGDPTVQSGRYLRWPEYSASKLANLLFTFELERRLNAAALPVKALAAHPGVAGTHLVANGQFGRSTGGPASILDAVAKAVTQSAHDGALPTLMAATADLPGGTYCGPSGFQELRGLPQVVGCTALAKDADAQRRLWEVSEAAVGLTWP
jgi:NAD(P)-dependent dehydrogenase (short-subunit alcohol dehydrogenase family)